MEYISDIQVHLNSARKVNVKSMSNATSWNALMFHGQRLKYTRLVGGWATPLKNMKVNWDDEIPNTWENKTCSKPPTRWSLYLNLWGLCLCMPLPRNVSPTFAPRCGYIIANPSSFSPLNGLLSCHWKQIREAQTIVLVHLSICLSSLV